LQDQVPGYLNEVSRCLVAARLESALPSRRVFPCW
jgi:hypothetical protein